MSGLQPVAALATRSHSPAVARATLPVFTYQRAFTYYQAGTGAALSNVMFALLLMAVTVYFVAFPPAEEDNDA